jgi:hypothetical protein
MPWVQPCWGMPRCSHDVSRITCKVRLFDFLDCGPCLSLFQLFYGRSSVVLCASALLQSLAFLATSFGPTFGLVMPSLATIVAFNLLLVL